MNRQECPPPTGAHTSQWTTSSWHQALCQDRKPRRLMTTSAVFQAQVHLLHLLGWTLQRSKIIPQEHSAWRPEQQSRYAGEAYRQMSHNLLHYPCFHCLNKKNLTPNPLETWLVSGMPFSHVIIILSNHAQGRPLSWQKLTFLC